MAKALEPLEPLSSWINNHTKEQLAALAALCETSPAYLQYQIAAGRRNPSPELARLLEIHTNEELKRTDLCSACGRCEFAKAR